MPGGRRWAGISVAGGLLLPTDMREKFFHRVRAYRTDDPGAVLIRGEAGRLSVEETGSLELFERGKQQGDHKTGTCAGR